MNKQKLFRYKTYKIDEFTPVVVENVYNKEASELFIEYFSENIKKNAFSQTKY